MAQPRSQPASDRPAEETVTDDEPSVGFTRGVPAVLDERYVLGAALGEGGMGTVIEAFDRRLDRTVAIKLLKRAARPETVERTRREARAIAQLAHPNVIEVFDIGTYGDSPYIVMERVDGVSLRDWQLQQPRPTWPQIVRAYLDVAAGLGAAHRLGIVHRDFKPANAMRDATGRVRVLDFGLAGADVSVSSQETSGSSLGDQTLTRVGTAMGTPAYMAPEQHEGWPVTPAADIFALGVSLYEALYGVRPYPKRPRAELAVVKRSGPPRPGPAERAGVPTALWRVVERALAPKPDDRWPSAHAMARALRAASRRVPRTMLGVAAGLCGVGLVFSLHTDSSDCTSRSAEVRRQWAEVEPRVRARLEAVGLQSAASDDMLGGLGAHAEVWADAMEATCHADTVAGDRARRCLERQHDAWLDLTSLLREGDVQRIRALGRAGALLDRPDTCMDPALADLQPMPRDATDREAVESLLAWEGKYTLARTSGQPEDAGALASALSEARALGHAPTVARLEHRAGLDALSRGHLEEAVLAFDRAIISAAEGGDTRRLVFSSIVHAHALARLKRPDEAERSRRRARAHWDAITAAPMDVYSATLEDAATLLDLGRDGEALAMSEPLLDPGVYAKLSTGTRATLHARLGSANVALDRPQDAAEHFQRQIDLLRTWLEPGNPSLLVPMANLAVALEDADLPEEAVEVYDDVLVVSRAYMEPEHLDRIFFESNAGYAMADVPARRAEAITLLEDVVNRAEQHATPMVQAQSLLGLAKAHALSDNGDDAVDAYRRARVIAESELGPEHPQTLDIVAKIRALEPEE